MSKKQKTAAARIAVLYIPLFIALALILVPFLWTMSTSFKTIPELQSEALYYLPRSLDFDDYSYIQDKSGFSAYFVNSTIVSSLSVVVVILLCICNVYTLGRYKFGGKSDMTLLLLRTQMMPVVLYLMLLFPVSKTIKLTDNPAVLITFDAILQTPFNTPLMRNFISGVPKGLDETAMVDGAGRIAIIYQILPPALESGVVAVDVFASIGCWNRFLMTSTFIQTQRKFTVPVGLKTMIGKYSINYPILTAGSVIAPIPPVILSTIIRRHLVARLNARAVKS